MIWRIYYGDGSVYSDEDGSNPPPRNVQVIISNDDGHISVAHSRDFYVKYPGYWDGVDWFGLFDYLMMQLPETLVLFGRTIANEQYLELYHRAIEERSLIK